MGGRILPLELIHPPFDSPLTDLIIELDHLRRKRLGGTTHPAIFFQLKAIFHIIESLGSARIEGNRTTLAEFIETRLEAGAPVGENIREIANMEQALEFIDTMVRDQALDHRYFRELHQLVVAGLTPPPAGEGDAHPGAYRQHLVRIAGSGHTPPDPVHVQALMDELCTFIRREDPPKYDLLKAAIAHHRFAWIHPFGNGNGRTVRLFTYAMLVRQDFRLDRIVNPTAVFCSDRDRYYTHLAMADTGTEEGMLGWCRYVLEGLKHEIEKIDRLLEHAYLQKEILIPALEYALEREQITETEARVLKKACEMQELQAGDLKEIYKGKQPAEISRQIRLLKEKRMLKPVKEGARKYVLRFDNNYLLRGIFKMLGEKGFLPIRGEVE